MFKTISLGALTILLAAAIIKYPDASFTASLQGLKIWWEIIFPALLPFFIVSELSLSFGVVHFIGVLLEPLMKPLFKVPGVGGFVLAMGFASGYPMGAKLTTRLREQNLISRIEGERLVSFTSTSDPLFLFGAIAVGFFNDPKLGMSLAFIHYVSSILVGLTMKYYKKNEIENTPPKIILKNERILLKAFRAMHQARLKETRKFGKLLGDAVMSSIETLLMIGGFIMIFSVILALLTKIQFTVLLGSFFGLILFPIGISTELYQSLIYGLFEVTLGVKSVSETSMNIPFVEKIAIVGAISAWGGISVHAQVVAIIQRTDLRYTPFLFARIIHSIFAFSLTFIFWKPLNLSQLSEVIPTLFREIQSETFSLNYWEYFILLTGFLIISTFMLVLISLSLNYYRKFIRKIS